MKTQLYYKSNETIYTKIPENMRGLVFGNKGHHLFELQEIYPVVVPPFIVLPTNFCRLYEEDEHKALLYLVSVIKQILPFFSGSLVSVRSGAPFSMPGLMETLLNVGITVENHKYWRETLGDSTFFNSLFRLRKMFGEIVLGHSYKTTYKSEEPIISLLDIKTEYTEKDQKTPEMLDFGSQLYYAIKAVWNSWNSEEARLYRQFHHLSNTGTAVVIQRMVFGNTEQGMTGVMFSSNIEETKSSIYGEYLQNAQGEDIVSGKVTPCDIGNLRETSLYEKLIVLAASLEEHYRWPQDIEWTYDGDQLYTLQTRDAKIPSVSRINFLYENIKGSTFTPLKHLSLDDFLIPSTHLVVPTETPFVKGKNASDGIARGILTFDPEKCTEKSIFFAPYTTVDVLPALMKCAGIVTTVGGVTSHAAVIARSLGKPCLIGLEEVTLVEKPKDSTEPWELNCGSFSFFEGEAICLDTRVGKLYKTKGAIQKNTTFIKKIKYIWKYIYKCVGDQIVYYDTNPQIYQSMYPQKIYIDEGVLPLDNKTIKNHTVYYGSPVQNLEKGFYQNFYDEKLFSFVTYMLTQNPEYILDENKKMEVVSLSEIVKIFKKEMGWISHG